jgi:hypothetical protein
VDGAGIHREALMTKNSKRKSQNRAAAAAAGSNYTTALRQRVSPRDAVVTAAQIGGLLHPSWTTGVSRADSVDLVREHLYAFAAGLGRAAHEDVAWAAARHLTAVKETLALHPGIVIDVSGDNWLEDRAGDRLHNRATGVTIVAHTLNVPTEVVGAGGVLQVLVATKCDRSGRFTIAVKVTIPGDADEVTPPAAKELREQRAARRAVSDSVSTEASWVGRIEQSADELRALVPSPSGAHATFLGARWADDRELSRDYSARNLCQMAAGEEHGFDDDCGFKSVLGGAAEHLVVYRSNLGDRELAAITCAPYPSGTDITWIRDAVAAAAERFGLSYRVGDPADDTYGHGTVPVVLWNPERAILV